MKQFVVSVFVVVALFMIFRPALGQDLGWSPTQGPSATQVNTFGSSGIVFYAGTNTGLYSSTNSGSSWTKNYYVTGIVRDIATKDQSIFVGGSAGVVISSDAGVTWFVRDTGLPQFSLVYAIKDVHDTLFACLGGDGIFRSVDSGKHWTKPYADIANRPANAMIATGTSLMIAEGLGIERSVNNGFSWNEPTDVISNQVVHTFLLKGSAVYAGTDAGVYKSTDDGATWDVSGTGISSNDIISSLTLSGDHKTIFAGTTNPNADVGVYRSIDDGATWSLVNNGLSNLSIQSLFAADGDDRVLAGSLLGISYSTNNGDAWQVASAGLPMVPVTALGSFYHLIYAGGPGNFIFTSNDAGQLWMQHPKGLTRANVTAILSIGSIVFAGTDALPSHSTGGLHISTDYGNSWTQLKNGIPIMAISQIVKYDAAIVVSGDSGIYSSSDNGNSWKQFSPLIATALYSDDTILYVGVKTAQTVWKYGKDFGWVSAGFTETTPIRALIKRAGRLFVGTDSGIYRSPDTVANPWQRIATDTIAIKCFWQNGLLLAAGTTTGIYISSDDGKSWQFQATAGKVQVNALSATTKDVFAATPTGVIKASLFGFAVHASPAESPVLLHVSNPSTDHALIHYTINNAGYTSLIVYGISGKQYGNIFGGHQDTGEYDLNWSTATLPTGTYILRLISGGNQSTAKVSVVH